MAAVQTQEYETVLKEVHAWPAERRFALVRDVLDMLAAEAAQPRARTLDRALGLLATAAAPPDDADARQASTGTSPPQRAKRKRTLASNLSMPPISHPSKGAGSSIRWASSSEPPRRATSPTRSSITSR
jgi:hypothetical protein